MSDTKDAPRTTLINNDEPNRLLDVEVIPVSVDPVHGFLEMQTDQGQVTTFINQNIAALLIHKLQKFLSTEQSDVDPIFNNTPKIFIKDVVIGADGRTYEVKPPHKPWPN
ncbi:hypothetical protein [Bradyrhizobium sp. G127]|uniref:hypothetical protein n=1 Tax=Bradyrhizobium sp. G127 TaxID=2904800 RepID=UPI001F166CAF|nr:hypothetical protein [Bradyrhizobium sp. G127]MCF2522356.1 hypothetical protein [Bradyrhizobium sp. G127]